MKLINKVRVERWPSGQDKPIGLFLCPICGKETEKPLYCGLRYKSCGCNQTPSGEGNPKWRHGESGNPLYGVWSGMISRCRCDQPKNNPYYRDRGVRVCAAWKKAAPFLRWAKANGYRRGLVLDRIDNDQGYSPENCRFVSVVESSRNTRRRAALYKVQAAIVNAVKSKAMTVADAEKSFGVCNSTIRRWVKLP